MKNVWILATADAGGDIIRMEEAPAATGTRTQQDGAPDTPQGREQQSPGLMNFLPIILIFVIMYLFMFRGPKKKQQEHQRMVQALKKNDRVRTIGGIFGTVLDVRDDEIVLKIDESTNTKMRVSPAAIATVLSDTKIEK